MWTIIIRELWDIWIMWIKLRYSYINKKLPYNGKRACVPDTISHFTGAKCSVDATIPQAPFLSCPGNPVPLHWWAIEFERFPPSLSPDTPGIPHPTTHILSFSSWYLYKALYPCLPLIHKNWGIPLGTVLKCPKKLFLSNRRYAKGV